MTSLATPHRTSVRSVADLSTMSPVRSVKDVPGLYPGYCLLPTAYCLLATAYWLLATGYWLSHKQLSPTTPSPTAAAAASGRPAAAGRRHALRAMSHTTCCSSIRAKSGCAAVSAGSAPRSSAAWSAPAVSARSDGSQPFEMEIEVRDVVVARARLRHREVEDRHPAVGRHEYVGGTEVGVDRDKRKVARTDPRRDAVEAPQRTRPIAVGQHVPRQLPQPDVQILAPLVQREEAVRGGHFLIRPDPRANALSRRCRGVGAAPRVNPRRATRSKVSPATSSVTRASCSGKDRDRTQGGEVGPPAQRFVQPMRRSILALDEPAQLRTFLGAPAARLEDLEERVGLVPGVHPPAHNADCRSMRATSAIMARASPK